VTSMSAHWSWQYLAADGSPVTEGVPQATAFPTQSEAESWLGESWAELADASVDAVTLVHGEEVVYGPMSLQP